MILVIDVGTSSVRVAGVDHAGEVHHLVQRPFLPQTPAPGLVEFDPVELLTQVLEMAQGVTTACGQVSCVGIAAQRASAVMWDRRTGVPVGPALGWQDLRTLGDCLTLRAEHGAAMAPNQSATKFAWLSTNAAADVPAAHRCAGTVDSWLAWSLSEGAAFVTDHTNAAVTGLYDRLSGTWQADLCAMVGVDPSWLPRIVDSAGEIARATRLPGAPTITALVGDQQSSLVGQGCVRSGMAKITFGTGGMLDLCRGDSMPATDQRSAQGTFPIVAWSAHGTRVWGEEAIMLSAGSAVEWLSEDMGLIDSPAHSEQVAASVPDAGGLIFVPALLGAGTPHWDYGARGTLLGLTRGSTRAHVVRAVLEGVAHRGADLVEATEAATGEQIDHLRIDGGMSRNTVFAQALATATGRPVDVSKVSESTLLGAAFLAGTAHGIWSDLDEAARTWQPLLRCEPLHSPDREIWYEASRRAAGWIPELSALDF